MKNRIEIVSGFNGWTIYLNGERIGKYFSKEMMIEDVRMAVKALAAGYRAEVIEIEQPSS